MMYSSNPPNPYIMDSIQPSECNSSCCRKLSAALLGANDEACIVIESKTKRDI